MTANNDIYKAAAKQLVLMVLVMALGRLTHGAALAIFAAAGCWAALTNKTGFALTMFILFPAMVVMNGVLLPKIGLTAHILRFGVLLIGLCLALASSRRRGAFCLPLMGLFVYSMYMFLPSSVGYCPSISFVKLVNFIVFLSGIAFGVRNLQDRPRELACLRTVLLALVIFFVVGSVLVYPFPGISTLQGVAMTKGPEGVDVGEASLRMKEMSQMGLFCGMFFQSQTLSGVLSCCFAWTVCDMLFVERRFRWPHVVLIILQPILIFLSRSRMGLLSIGMFSVVITLYTLHRIRLSSAIKQRIRSMMMMGFVLLVVVGGVAEVRSRTITRWIRKTDDLSSDSRGLTEAVTASRMGLIEKTMSEFRYNPLLGCGFQVEKWHSGYAKGIKGLILSAPIEKGLLPMMVLGESGVVGSLIFWAFILHFCSVCVRQRYIVTLTLFWTFFATNIGEATFFSPGGPGGIEWMYTVVGGFVIDMILYAQRSRAFMAFPYYSQNFRQTF